MRNDSALVLVSCHGKLKGADKPDEVKKLKELIESRLPRSELVDVLIDWTTVPTSCAASSTTVRVRRASRH